MKKITVYSLISMSVLIMACSTSPKENLKVEKTIVSPDSLMSAWNNAWNKTDANAISNMFTDQTQVVFSINERIVGRDSIMAKWVNINLPMVRNLKVNKIMSSSSSDLAYYAGDYTLDIVVNDSVIGSDIGCFTAVWKCDENKHWKMELMFFGENKKE